MKFDFEKYLEKFNRDFEASLKGNSRVFPLSNSYLKRTPFPKNRSVLALDMGGTNVRIAEVIFDEAGKPEIHNLKKFPMPGSIGHSALHVSEFFDIIANEISAYDEEEVGITFSYPCEILNDRDGRIICFSKQVKITDERDMHIGKELNRRLEKKRKITVLNDTVACLLGTENANMSLILGTGLNICFQSESGYIINTECGRYEGFPTYEFDFGPMTEQKVSGAYLNPLIEKLPYRKEEIYERGAEMIATEIIGISGHTEGKVRLAVEGSVFYNVHPLREKILSYLESYGPDFEILDGREKVLIGSAVGAL